jgi:CHASE3 domain sensor protein
MIRGLIVFTLCLLITAPVCAQQAQGKLVKDMTEKELLVASQRVEEMAKQLEVVTKAADSLLSDVLSYLRGKRAILIEDNNKLMRQFGTQSAAIKKRLKEIRREKKKTGPEEKEKKDGK